MGYLIGDYRLSLYSRLVEVSKGKVYLVKSSLDHKIYIKKILERKHLNLYQQIKKLSNSNIPKIYELIDTGDALILIQEYINGSSLEEILSKSHSISVDKIVRYAIDLTDIVADIHSAKPPIIHKDIKPSNIMVSNDGVLKLIDFDISRVYNKGQNTDTHILGTHGYAAPEQFGFNQTDKRTDIYSIGVTINIMLTGKFPNQQLHQGKLSKIILKCIEMDPDQRYQNANKLKKDLLKVSRRYEIEGIDLHNRLPGFRSKYYVIRILAFSWYMFLTMVALGVFTENGISADRKLDISIVLYCLAITFLYGNYKNIKSKLPLLRSQHLLLRLLAYIIYPFLIFIIWAIIMPI